MLSALCKIITSILNNQLYDYMVQKGILKAEQRGFRKMHGTVNSIFTLKTLIDKYVKSTPQKHQNLLFSCFVDFRKAFNCISRQKLVDKLRKEGVHGHFLDVLISMYSNDKSAVKLMTNPWWPMCAIGKSCRARVNQYFFFAIIFMLLISYLYFLYIFLFFIFIFFYFFSFYIFSNNFYFIYFLSLYFYLFFISFYYFFIHTKNKIKFKKRK